MTESTSSIARRRTLVRPHTGRVIGGVCAGAADYLRVDLTLVRIALVLFTVLGGAGLAVYIAGWLVIPEEGADRSVLGQLLHR